MNKTLSLAAMLGIAGGMLAFGAPASAHHSYAMFDRTKVLTLTGTVRTWELVNPHAYLWVYVSDDKGGTTLWGLEAPGVQALMRAGWKKNTVQPGDKVTVVINPLTDGRPGGNLAQLTLADGRTLRGSVIPDPNASPKPNAAANQAD